jgi:hypothetical protein
MPTIVNREDIKQVSWKKVNTSCAKTRRILTRCLQSLRRNLTLAVFIKAGGVLRQHLQTPR